MPGLQTIKTFQKPLFQGILIMAHKVIHVETLYHSQTSDLHEQGKRLACVTLSSR